MEGEDVQRHLALSGSRDQGVYLWTFTIGRRRSTYFGVWIGAVIALDVCW